MLRNENLAANFCGLLSQKGCRDSAKEFKILGQERDGTLITSWISLIRQELWVSNIGSYNPKEKLFNIIHTFSSTLNIIQASINISRTLLVYVTKEEFVNDDQESVSEDSAKFVYKPFLIPLNKAGTIQEIPLLDVERSNQVFVQFMWPKQQKNDKDRFLVMIHQEGIYLHTTNAKEKNPEAESGALFDKGAMKVDLIVKNFIWSQWEPKIQTLFYIHLKQSTRMSLEKEEDEKVINPTLSAFQFHDDLPTETVLNIPLNLPKIPCSSKCSEYEDDTVPLRIHDSSLNLILVSDEEKGMLFICHYYLYQPMKQDENQSSSAAEVHFAYSVTIVHYSQVIHCIIPGIPWETAKLMKPTFTLLNDYLLVYQAGLFMQLLDIGLDHEPCGHIIAKPYIRQSHHNVTHLVPCFNSISYDSVTLDLISIQIPNSHLIETFKNDESFDNRLSIIHYFMAHHNDFDIFADLLNIIMKNPLNLDTVGLLKEALLGGTYSIVKKGLSAEAMSLSKLLPLTTCQTLKPIQAKIGDLSVGLSHETLHNTAMMLLSPQQRLSPYRQDIWTRLYDRLNENKDSKKRFNCDQVTEKLIYSLACYQPEALSRCTTPQTPLKSDHMSFCDLSNINNASSSAKRPNDMLPFIEFETCTASRQEHVISVNLRELSMFLVKNSVKQVTGFRWLKDSYFDATPAPSFVHAISTRYVSAQLEVSRLLCIHVCRAAGIDARIESERGFTLIDKLSSPQLYLLFLLLERYCLAIQSLSFPLPQGFSSFFTYLGYRALEFDEFLEYAQHHSFELQIDVMKTIMNDIKDTDDDGVRRKMSLLSLLPRTRARRLLNNWNHPISLNIRAREHANNILSGNPVTSRSLSTANKKADGIIGKSSAIQAKRIENMTSLNSLLDLLTCKASLNDLDFNLLIDSTISSLNYENIE